MQGHVGQSAVQGISHPLNSAAESREESGLGFQTFPTCKWQTRLPALPWFLEGAGLRLEKQNLKEALGLLAHARGKGKICNKLHLEFHFYFTG